MRVEGKSASERHADTVQYTLRESSMVLGLSVHGCSMASSISVWCFVFRIVSICIRTGWLRQLNHIRAMFWVPARTGLTLIGCVVIISARQRSRIANTHCMSAPSDQSRVLMRVMRVRSEVE